MQLSDRSPRLSTNLPNDESCLGTCDGLTLVLALTMLASLRRSYRRHSSSSSRSQRETESRSWTSPVQSLALKFIERMLVPSARGHRSLLILGIARFAAAAAAGGGPNDTQVNRVCQPFERLVKTIGSQLALYERGRALPRFPR